MAENYQGSITLATVRNGQPGSSFYTYIRYATNSSGANMSDDPTGCEYIGVYTGPESSAPTNPSLYTWSKYVGEDGAPGTPGAPGTSVTIASTAVEYAVSSNGETAPSTGWQSTIPHLSKGQYLWTKTTVVYSYGSQTSSTISYSVSYQGEDGAAWIINTNVEQINKFSSTDITLPISLTSQIISFNVTEKESDTTLLIPGTDYSYKINCSVIATSQEGAVATSYNDLATLFNGVVISDAGGNDRNLRDVAITINSELQQVNFNLLESFQYNFKSGNEQWYNNYQNVCLTFNLVFIIEIYDLNDVLIVQKPIFYSFGTNQDMARFSLNAADITAAINNAGFRFSGEGLTITNGSLVIKDSNNNNYLTFTPGLGEQPGLLEINGSGTFSGELNAATGTFSGELSAASGTFNGEIRAASGTIGGFEITGTSLQSTEGTGSSRSLVLDGASGKITADNIELGTGAIINNYINLGSAKLLNPNYGDNNGYILTTDNGIKLSQDGLLEIGNLSLDGESSTIRGANWYIDPDTASFKNIVASGRITTAVFEQNKTQLMGGITIFKPSYKVKAVVLGSTTTLTLDTPEGESFTGNSGDIIRLIDSNGAAIDDIVIDSINGNEITITTDDQDKYSDVFSIIDIGQTVDGLKPIIIGINSTTADTPIPPQGLTISEYENGLNNIKVFLGNLGTSKIAGIDNKAGYGLYSNNVFLTGSLITQVATDSYAGVNTLTGVPSTKDDGAHKPIVFWAGAQSNSAAQIQEAPFQVTDNGYLYASKGYFTGSLIVKSTIRGAAIEAADIYTARIHGKNFDNDQAGELGIYDTSNGIVFYQTVNNNAEPIFTIKSTGFEYKNGSFISIENNVVKSTFNESTIGSININNKYLRYSKLVNGVLTYPTSVEIGDNSFKVSHSAVDKLSINQTQTVNSNDVYNEKNIYYGSSMRYVKVESNGVEVGYDLYIGG